MQVYEVVKIAVRAQQSSVHVSIHVQTFLRPFILSDFIPIRGWAIWINYDIMEKKKKTKVIVILWQGSRCDIEGWTLMTFKFWMVCLVMDTMVNDEFDGWSRLMIETPSKYVV